MELSQTIEKSPLRATGRSVRRLSRGAGFWAVAFSFLVVAAFSTAPSSLYGLYEQREHLSSLMITFVYAIYAVGVVGSLVLAGHVSDWYGRRMVLLPAITVAIASAVLLRVWRSLPGLLVARVLTGVAVGAAVPTATAFITDLDSEPAGLPTRRARIVSTIANIGGLAVGPLIAGVLARYEQHGLTLPFQVFVAALALAGIPSRSHPKDIRLFTLVPDIGRSTSRSRQKHAGGSPPPPVRFSASLCSDYSRGWPAHFSPDRCTIRQRRSAA